MYLSQADITTYYSTVFNVTFTGGQRHVFMSCLFARHSDPVTIDLHTGRWSCRYCGSGDLFSFEELKLKRSFRIRCQQSVLEIIASAREQAAGAPEPSTSPQMAPDTFETRDVKKLLSKILRHAGQTRAYYQRLSHWSRYRFRRAVGRLERESLVRWEDSTTRGGKKRRTYFPISECEPSSNLK